MNTNKGNIVKQSGNDVEGCRSEKVSVQPNMRVFLQYSVKINLIFYFPVTADARQPWTDSLDCYFEYLIIHFDYFIILLHYLIIG